MNLAGPEPRGKGAMVKSNSLDFTNTGDLWNMGIWNGIWNLKIIRNWIVCPVLRGCIYL